MAAAAVMAEKAAEGMATAAGDRGWDSAAAAKEG